MAISDVDIAQVIYLVAWAHHAVPASYHVLVHLFHRTETVSSDQASISVLEAQDVSMPKMRVADDPDLVHEASVLLTLKLSSTCSSQPNRPKRQAMKKV